MIQEIKFDAVDSNGYAKKIAFRNKCLGNEIQFVILLIKPFEIHSYIMHEKCSGKRMHHAVGGNIQGKRLTEKKFKGKRCEK